MNGAHEIDMVLNIGALKSKDLATVGQDIQLVAQACHAREAICKVIIETAYLTDEEKISACSVAKASGADFVKTSTGFGPGGASAKDVALMRSVVGDDVGVKASGGIRDWKMLQEMVQSGATRIGASASVKILQEAKSLKKQLRTCQCRSVKGALGMTTIERSRQRIAGKVLTKLGTIVSPPIKRYQMHQRRRQRMVDRRLFDGPQGAILCTRQAPQGSS